MRTRVYEPHTGFTSQSCCSVLSHLLCYQHRNISSFLLGRQRVVGETWFFSALNSGESLTMEIEPMKLEAAVLSFFAIAPAMHNLQDFRSGSDKACTSYS